MLSQESQARQSSCKVGQAEAYLDISNIRARIPNQGGLFFRQSPSVFEAPKNSGTNGIFAAGLWISGEVNGDLRMAATTYNGYEFWPGILDEEGNPPEDCIPFDRIYDVSVHDFLVYDSLGIVTDDLRDWPWRHGAPVIDGDGITDNYNLEGGDRPDLLGDQSLFWMMQDRSGEHTYTDTDPIGIEIRAMAGAMYSEDPALANTTFYKYTLRYRGDQPLDDAYIGLFVDPDLGDFSDDFVGADTSLGMGYVYNADNDDEGDYGYGEAPPAIGIDVLQGPLVDQDGLDNDKDGQIDEANERLSMEVFVFNDGVEDGYGGVVSRNHMQGLLFNGDVTSQGTPILEGCVPFVGCLPEASMDTTTIMAPGDPVTRQFWSETNYWEDQPATPSDRKMLISSGPFTMQPGDEQEVVFGIVYARGVDHLDAITELRIADRMVQQAWDAGTVGPSIFQVNASLATPVPLSPADGVAQQPLDTELVWTAVEDADAYFVELSLDADFSNAEIRRAKTLARLTASRPRYHLVNTAVTWSDLSPASIYHWRVRAANASGLGQPSPSFTFSTGNQRLTQGSILKLPDGSLGFFEVQTPGGNNTCEGTLASDPGCMAYGVNLVHNDYNSTAAYKIVTPNQFQDSRFEGYAPNDFEIRFTSSGSYAAQQTYDDEGNMLYRGFKVPFEIWDIGPTGPVAPNDPADDIQLIVGVYDYANENCNFIYSTQFLDTNTFATPAWFVIYPEGATYDTWATAVNERVETTGSDRCASLSGIALPDLRSTMLLNRLHFMGDSNAPDYRAQGPAEGTVIRIVTSPEGLTAPFPASPVDGSGFQGDRVILRWQAGDRVFNHIQLSVRPDFSAPIFNDTLFNAHEIEIPDLAFATTYYWRARSYMHDGPPTAWSPTWQFTVGTATGIEVPSSEVPETFEIQQNYPNPFQQATTFRIGLPKADRVRLDVFNLLGQRVATIVDRRYSPGWYNFEWQPQQLGSGIYFVTATSSNEQRTLKVIKIR